jgi:transcriptional regulator with XRE-family HTH domain
MHFKQGAELIMSAKNIAMGERIRRARKSLNLTQQEFAARLEVTQPTVHRWEKGFYDPDESALQRLAEMTDLPPAYYRYGEQALGSESRQVELVGYVGTGAQIDPLTNAGAGQTFDNIEAPSGETLSTVAVIVRDDSLYPVYQGGDVIFYSRDVADSEAAYLGRECVVKLIDGPMLLKRVMRGSDRGSYLLLSYNASPMDGARLEWARPVRWIKRR